MSISLIATLVLVGLVIALGVTNQPVLIGAVIVSGAFIGAGLAPYVAGRLAAGAGLRAPFFLAVAAVAVSLVILASGHRFLTAAERATRGGATAGTAARTAGETAALAASEPAQQLGQRPGRPPAFGHLSMLVKSLGVA